MLVDFNAWKTHLVLLEESNNSGSVDVMIVGSVLEEKSSFAGVDSLFGLDWGALTWSL